MSVNEINLSTVENRNALASNRLLGTIAIIGAPMLFTEMLLRISSSDPEKLAGEIVGALGIFYMGGWIAGALGMRRLRATGNGTGGKIVFVVQMIGLILAFLFSVQELFGVSYENGNLLFTITDVAYPFSHVFMLVVGYFVWRAGVWRGIKRIAPLMVGAALPLFFALVSFAGMTVAGICFSGLAAIGLGIIGCSVFTSRNAE